MSRTPPPTKLEREQAATMKRAILEVCYDQSATAAINALLHALATVLTQATDEPRRLAEKAGRQLRINVNEMLTSPERRS